MHFNEGVSAVCATYDHLQKCILIQHPLNKTLIFEVASFGVMDILLPLVSVMRVRPQLCNILLHCTAVCDWNAAYFKKVVLTSVLGIWIQYFLHKTLNSSLTTGGVVDAAPSFSNEGATTALQSTVALQCVIGMQCISKRLFFAVCATYDHL